MRSAVAKRRAEEGTCCDLSRTSPSRKKKKKKKTKKLKKPKN
jgi:hypothetical protein